jgi:hypothetical protein
MKAVYGILIILCFVALAGARDYLIINREITLSNNYTLTPTPNATAECSQGSLYMDTSGAYCVCVLTDTWENMGTTGTCE